MSIRLKQRLTYANVTSTLALLLVVSGGGVAVAAGALAPGSVGSPQIKNGSVKSVDIKNSTIKSSDIKNRTVKSSDIRDHHLRGVDIKDGSISARTLDQGPLGVVRGYAWMNLSATDGVLDNGYVYNPSGGDVTSDHTAVGVYAVTFDGLNIGTGHVQVTAYGGDSVFCKVSSWGSFVAHVHCFDVAGNPANSQFTLAMIE